VKYSYIRRIFGKDGACVEGLHYGFVNLMHTLPCLQALKVRDGTNWFEVSYIRDRLNKVPQWITYETLPFPQTHTSSSNSRVNPIMNILNDTHNHGGYAGPGEDGYDPFDNALRTLTLSGLYNDQDMGVWVFHQVYSSLEKLYEPAGRLNSSDQLTIGDFILAMLYYNDTSVTDTQSLFLL
jgi:hypothetical protein